MYTPSRTCAAAAAAASTCACRFVGCNWKCSLDTTAKVDALLAAVAARWARPADPGAACTPAPQHVEVDLVILPPFPYLDRAVRALGPGAGVAGVAIGAQNMLEATPGAGGTGSVTAAMLADLGCRWL